MRRLRCGASVPAFGPACVWTCSGSTALARQPPWPYSQRCAASIAGRVTICGHYMSTAAGTAETWKVLGVRAQADLIIDGIPGCDFLLVLGRIKRVPNADLEATVDKLLQRWGLLSAPTRKASIHTASEPDAERLHRAHWLHGHTFPGRTFGGRECRCQSPPLKGSLKSRLRPDSGAGHPLLSGGRSPLRLPGHPGQGLAALFRHTEAPRPQLQHRVPT